jgi:predicted ArsR family transcriptional regulator
METKRMRNKRWALLSNHGKVYAYLAGHKDSTTQGIAQEIGISIRAVQNIIDDLEEEGYLQRQKIGRRNNYIIYPGVHARSGMETDYAVGRMLVSLIDKHHSVRKGN